MDKDAYDKHNENPWKGGDGDDKDEENRPNKQAMQLDNVILFKKIKIIDLV